MSHRHLHYFLGVTEYLSDQELEQVVAEIRQVRRARAEAVAYERQMHTATGGISHRYAQAASPDSVRSQLIASYFKSGMTELQISQRLREMDDAARALRRGGR